MTTNTALAPTTPRVDKITCVFERYGAGGAESDVHGTAMLTLQVLIPPPPVGAYTPLTESGVHGPAMLTLQVPCNAPPCKARVQAKLQGLSCRGRVETAPRPLC